MQLEIENAVIRSAKFDTENGVLSAWVQLEFRIGGQGFGGFVLYTPKPKTELSGRNYCGHFVWRVLQIAGVAEWSELPGRTIRARHNDGYIEAIGHIVKDDWFNPKEEFAAMKGATNGH